MSYNPQKYCSPEDTAKQQSSSQKYSNAERYSHINNAEVKKTEVRYGSVEQQPSTANVVGGAAGGAATSGSSTLTSIKPQIKVSLKVLFVGQTQKFTEI